MTRGSKPHIARHDCRERLGLRTLYVATACVHPCQTRERAFFAVCAASVYLRYVRSGQVGTCSYLLLCPLNSLLFFPTYDLCSIHAYLTHSCTDTGSHCDSPPSDNIKLPLLKNMDSIRSIQARQVYYGGYGRRRYGYSRWNHWGRWVLLGVILLVALVVLLLFSYVSCRLLLAFYCITRWQS